ncbi:ABC transporter ATP-binding protein [Candidatus Caldatribacterium sp.]|uniref:ABC transporter ATP-binding protein n=1 Tax=Candidatus Caldatribacterium sp. TaxID=2282143 RepID=UPI002995C65B|nr:ABC transporter ATP-binding protein/permease [Candidatus Caldatribacterium sp.]MDW8080945.1 ABC transporter ATP-binding protein [Candidatus Calescibacterium sp.]
MPEKREQEISFLPGRGPRHFPTRTERPKDPKKTIQQLWQYFKGQQSKVVLVTLCVGASSLCFLLGPYLIGRVIDEAIIPRNALALARFSCILVLLYLGTSLFSFFQERLAISLAQHVAFTLRNEAFASLHALPMGFFDSHEHGDIMSRLTNDIDNLSNTLATTATQLLSSLVTFIGTVVFMLILHHELTFVALSIIPLTLLATRFVLRKTRETFSMQQAVLGKLNSIFEEDITGFRVIKAFTQETREFERFEEVNESFAKVGTIAQIYAGIMGPLMNAINNASLALLAGFGGWFALRGMASVGAIASFIAYSRQLIRPVSELATQFNMLQSALASSERVFALLDEPQEPPDPLDTCCPQRIRGVVEFRNVSFSYQKGVPVLKNVSFSVEPGQVVALVGPTGAGKTTIVNLLARFYEPESGIISIDGIDIRRMRRESLRSLLSIVLQDTYLFATTVLDNIRYGKPQASDDEVRQAARLAGAEHFILGLPQGYHTVLSEGGENLSQGQRQLLAIARAFLVNPVILVLDEATSNVDTHTERLVQEAMLRLMKGRTTFIIAHRLNTIRKADLILVLSNGEIVERGTHEELLKKQGLYARLYASQTGERLIEG